MLRRHLVGGETGSVDIERVLFVGGGQDFQHADLGLEVESVARLGLDGCGAVGEKGVESSEGPGEEVSVWRRHGSPGRWR